MNIQIALILGATAVAVCCLYKAGVFSKAKPAATSTASPVTPSIGSQVEQRVDTNIKPN